MKGFYENLIMENKSLSYMSDLVNQYKKELNKIDSRIDSANNHKVYTTNLLLEIEGTDKDTLTRHTYKVYYMAQNSFGAMIKR
jgi:hypothetical protein